MDRIQELESLILKNQDLYYNGKTELSDEQFDCLWDELKVLDPTNSIFDSVGKDSSSEFKKVKHFLTMGSQNKANSLEEVLKWACQFSPSEELLSEYKLDGCSLSLNYMDGILTSGVTRGNGVVGDDITENVKKMNGCLTSINSHFSGSVRGEILLSKDNKNKYYPEMANCRNAASGIMKRLDGEGCEHLDIIVYDLKSSDNAFSTESDKLKFLESSGFTVAFNQKVFANELSTVIHPLLISLDKERKEDSFKYDIDGIVLKKNTFDETDLAETYPKTQIAYKFPREEALSTLNDVEWSLSNGTLTPIGVIQEVQLCGTNVKRASLCNLRLIEQENFRLGSTVVITKRGEIIPKIERVISSPEDSTEIVAPKECPLCSSTVEVNSDKTRTYCTNESCPSILIGKIDKWLTTLEIKEIAPTTLMKLLSANLFDGSISSLYNIDFSKVSDLEGFGDRSSEILKKNLLSVKEVYLSDFVAGFNITNIGRRVSEKIINHTKATSLEDLFSLTATACVCDGVGIETATKFITGLAKEKYDMTLTLNYVKIKTVDLSTGNLVGKTFCFTGSLNSMKRSEAEKLVKDNGGTACKDVIKGLTYLVTNDPNSGSSKNKKALSQGTLIITEEDFLQMVQ